MGPATKWCIFILFVLVVGGTLGYWWWQSYTQKRFEASLRGGKEELDQASPDVVIQTSSADAWDVGDL